MLKIYEFQVGIQNNNTFFLVLLIRLDFKVEKMELVLSPPTAPTPPPSAFTKPSIEASMAKKTVEILLLSLENHDIFMQFDI